MTQRAQYLHLQNVVFFVLEKKQRNVLNSCSGDNLSVAMDIENSIFLPSQKGNYLFLLFNCKQNSVKLNSREGVNSKLWIFISLLMEIL